MMHRMRLLLIISIVLLVSACATYTDPMTSSSAYPMGGRLTESEIAAIVTTAHQGEVDQGNAALGRASSAEARALAQMLVTDHTNALNNARNVFSRNNITTMANDTSRTLASGSQQTITALNTYSGAAFDRAFAQAQVNQHQWLLTTLDTVLIPSARTAEVRTLLQTHRTSVSNHLDHARRVLQNLP